MGRPNPRRERATANLQGEEISNLYSAHRCYEGLGIWGKASADSVTLTSNLTTSERQREPAFEIEDKLSPLFFSSFLRGKGQFRLSSKNTIYRLDVHRTTDVRLCSLDSPAATVGSFPSTCTAPQFLHVSAAESQVRRIFERQPRKRPQLR